MGIGDMLEEAEKRFMDDLHKKERFGDLNVERVENYGFENHDKGDLDDRYLPLTTANWFFTFMCMNIPVIGLIYLLVVSFSKSQPLKRDFARAYILYQILFLSISVILVFVFCYYGLEIADNALKFMQEL